MKYKLLRISKKLFDFNLKYKLCKVEKEFQRNFWWSWKWEIRISLEHWKKFFVLFRCDSIPALKQRLPILEQELRDPAKFREFYQFTFNFAKVPAQKGLDLEYAIAYWNMVLRNRFKYLDLWCDFLKVKNFRFFFIFIFIFFLKFIQKNFFSNLNLNQIFVLKRFYLKIFWNNLIISFIGHILFKYKFSNFSFKMIFCCEIQAFFADLDEFWWILMSKIEIWLKKLCFLFRKITTINLYRKTHGIFCWISLNKSTRIFLITTKKVIANDNQEYNHLIN